MVFVLIGVSAHPVWIGLILSYFLGYRFHLAPIAGYCDFFNQSTGADCGGPTQWAYHMILPWMTFALLYAALYVRMIRANVMEAKHEDYVRTAVAKGASQSRVMRVHVLRNALLPIVTILGMDIGFALDRHIDPHLGVTRQPYPARQVLEKERSPRPYDDLFHTASPSVTYEVVGERIPPQPEHDLLWFLSMYAPLEPWQQDVPRLSGGVVLLLSEFLHKTLNEGWASYWHAELFHQYGGVSRGDDRVCPPARVWSIPGSAEPQSYYRAIPSCWTSRSAGMPCTLPMSLPSQADKAL
jgi:hypothetical protein